LPGWTESAPPRAKSSPAPSKSASPRAKSTPPPTPPKKALTYGERIELDKILGVIAKTEEELTSVEARLADPTLYATRGTEVRPLEEERARIAQRVAELTARWEDLEDRKDVAK
jgi:ATP-binding cassette subfamily F protein uup